MSVFMIFNILQCLISEAGIANFLGPPIPPEFLNFYLPPLFYSHVIIIGQAKMTFMGVMWIVYFIDEVFIICINKIINMIVNFYTKVLESVHRRHLNLCHSHLEQNYRDRERNPRCSPRYL